MALNITGTPHPARSNHRILARIASSFRPYLPQVILVGVLILFSAGLGVINPLLVQVVFDQALFPASGEPDLDLLWTLSALMAGVIVVTSGIGILQTYLTNSVGQRVMRDLRDRLFRHLQSLSLNFFTGTRTGEVQSRVANDVGGVRNVVTTTVTDVVSNVVILVSTVVAMAVLSWELTLVAVGVVPFFAFVSKKVGGEAAGSLPSGAGIQRRDDCHYPGDSVRLRHHVDQALRAAGPGG